jgi:TetR/AcrR family transcriptional regulator, repressor of fatR-cypB operon
MSTGKQSMELRPYLAQDDAAARAAGLCAALRLFVRHGIDATSVRDIAAGSGFTNPAIFKHFDSKEALALCLFERCYTWMGTAFRAASEAVTGGAEQKLAATVECALRLIDEDQEALLYVQENLRRFWRQASPETRQFSLLGHIRALLDARSGSPVERNLQASAIIGLIGQLAREAYFGELPGTALSQAQRVNAIIMRIIN